MADQELLQQLEQVRAQRALAKPKRYRRSRLDRHRAEIQTLQEAGASLAEIQLWLLRYKRIKVHATTIGRALERWDKREG